MMKNKRYTPNNKNGGIVPELKDGRTLYVPIPCNRCMACKKTLALKWKVRLMEEIRSNEKNKYFVTLTFSDEALIRLERKVKIKVNKQLEEAKKIKFKFKYNGKLKGYALDNEMVTVAIKKQREQIRLYNKNHKINEKTKYWLITELGQNKTERVHLHGIIFTNQIELFTKLWEENNGKVTIGNGHGVNYVTDKSINYMTKYVTKMDFKHKYYTPKVFASHGIGLKYIERPDAKRHKYNGEKTILHYTTRQGIKLPLDKYYKNHILTDEEREKLWIMQLDTNTRFVDGVKIDVSNGEEEYNRAINAAREKAKRLGYNDNTIDEDVKAYELAKRNEIKEKRLQKEYKVIAKKYKL